MSKANYSRAYQKRVKKLTNKRRRRARIVKGAKRGAVVGGLLAVGSAIFIGQKQTEK